MGSREGCEGVKDPGRNRGLGARRKEKSEEEDSIEHRGWDRSLS